MLDMKFIIVGVAGIFVALGLAGAVLLGMGHATSTIGQAVDSGPIAQAGDALTGYGVDLIVFLAVLAVAVVLAFLYLLLH